jgi:Domain of unknown function (DUF4192)
MTHPALPGPPASPETLLPAGRHDTITIAAATPDIPGFGTAAYLPYAMTLARAAYLHARQPELQAAAYGCLTRASVPPGPHLTAASREQLLAIVAHDYTRSLHASRIQGGMARPLPKLAWQAVAPVTGRLAASMRRHTLAATDVLQYMDQDQRREHGRRLVDKLLTAAGGPAPLGHAQAAALITAIADPADPAVRDHGWSLMLESGTRDQHLNLWVQATKLAGRDLRAAPACLTALVAWHHDDLLLAHAAVNQALQSHPDYQLACVIRGSLTGTIRADLRHPGLGPDAVAREHNRRSPRRRPSATMTRTAAGFPRRPR